MKQSGKHLETIRQTLEATWKHLGDSPDRDWNQPVGNLGTTRRQPKDNLETTWTNFATTTNQAENTLRQTGKQPENNLSREPTWKQLRNNLETESELPVNNVAQHGISQREQR